MTCSDPRYPQHLAQQEQQLVMITPYPATITLDQSETSIARPMRALVTMDPLQQQEDDPLGVGRQQQQHLQQQQHQQPVRLLLQPTIAAAAGAFGQL